MNQRTSDKLKELTAISWFANVGQPLSEEFLSVNSWEEATKLCASDVWSSVQLQIKNQFADVVNLRDYYRCEEWNGIAEELQPSIDNIIRNSVKPIEDKFNLSPDLRGAVSWDILSICLEAEFADVVQPTFFIPRLQPIYTSGHFPCGWDGPKLEDGWEGGLPESKLIVY